MAVSARPVQAGDVAETLASQIVTRQALVAVMGLGYVGLPLAVECARNGFAVIGVDIDATRVSHVNAGRSYLLDVPSHLLGPLVADGKVSATQDPAAMAGVDVVIVCVPTPITRHKEPDVAYLTNAAHTLRRYLPAGRLVVLRRISYPGTTEELVRPILEADGLKVGTDLFLAFAPERINPGSQSYSLRDVPIVVGGCDPRSTELAKLFLQQVTSTVVPVSGPTTAEMVKLLENVFRNVNIALVNHMAMLCDRMGLNIWEIIAAAATKPYGFMSFQPGLVGGHCIPVDPYFLAWKAREYDFHSDFIELAARVNDAMPYFVVNRVVAALNQRHKGVDGTSVLALGVTFNLNPA